MTGKTRQSSSGFAGEKPENLMKKTQVASPRVSCGTCRMFDGMKWCRHWNFHTTAESPPCRFYTKGAARPPSA